MKKTWRKPVIAAEEFVANEYVATCWVYTDTGIITRTKAGTDGRSDVENDWQGKKKGFSDDGYDFLSGQEDIIPKTGAGWYCSKDGLDTLHSSSHNPQKFNDTEYGNKVIPYGKTKPVYFLGSNWPTQLTSSNCEQYGVGPNAS